MSSQIHYLLKEKIVDFLKDKKCDFYVTPDLEVLLKVVIRDLPRSTQFEKNHQKSSSKESILLKLFK